MKWSRRPSCSFLTSLAAVTTTTQTSSTSVYAFCVRRGRGSISFSTKTTSSKENETPPRLTVPNTNPYFTYTLGTSTGNYSDTLYVPFTSFCNARTLPQIRGPNFRLPPTVVAALCRVRDEEIYSTIGTRRCGSDSTSTTAAKYQKKYAFWCQWLDTQESYQMLPPPLPESLTPPPLNLEDDIPPKGAIRHRPTVEELMVEVQQWYYYKNSRIDASNPSRQTPKTIVIAGEGEPTLRLYDLMQFVHQLQSFITMKRSDNENNKNKSDVPNVQLRIMTNGLLTHQQTNELLQCCCSTTTSVPLLPIIISVLFISSDSIQYNDIMQPCLPSVDGDNVPVDQPQVITTPHEMVQQFIRTVVDVISKQSTGTDSSPPLLSIEVTAIDRPDVNKEALSKFITSLGVTTPIRWRPFFP